MSKIPPRIFAKQELALCQLPASCQADPLLSIEWPNIPKRGDVPLLVVFFNGVPFSASSWCGFSFFATPSCQWLAAKLIADFPSLIHASSSHGYAVQISGSGAACNAVLNVVFNALLVYGRPLKHYGCTFYLPLYADKELSKDTIQSSDAFEIVAKTYDNDSPNTEAQAYLYFQPPIRDFLFGSTQATESKSTLKPIKEWHLQPKQDWFLQLAEEHLSLSARLTDVVLYQYFNDLCVLAVTVAPKKVLPSRMLKLAEGFSWLQAPRKNKFFPEYNYWWNDCWWQHLAFANDATWQLMQSLQLDNWLRFTKLARVLFASFTEQVKEHKIAEISLLAASENYQLATESQDLKIEPIADKLKTHPIIYLLKCFFGKAQGNDEPVYFNRDFHHFYDDRLFVNVAYGYVGGQLRTDDADRLFSVALYVDVASDTFDAMAGYAYEPSFIRDLMAKDAYMRWRGIGIYAGYSHYSNVYFGQSGFFCNVIAPVHVPFIYGRMLLMTLFYQASLRHYRAELMQISKDVDYKPVQELRRKFMLFTNGYWFRDVTSQVQGREVFLKQQQALELQRDYEFIKEELVRLDEYMDAKSDKQLREFSHELNIAVYLFSIVSLCLTFTQLLFDAKINDNSKELANLWTQWDLLKIVAIDFLLILGLILILNMVFRLIGTKQVKRFFRRHD